MIDSTIQQTSEYETIPSGVNGSDHMRLFRMNSPDLFANKPIAVCKHFSSNVLVPVLCALSLTLLSACGGSSSTPAPNAGTTGDGEDTGGIDTGGGGTTGNDSGAGNPGEGTIAASREELMSFMMQFDGPGSFREFWLCTFSDGSVPGYIVFDGTDDATDPGFNPFLISGKTRNAVLPGDPRSFNRETESTQGIIVSIEAVITSSDSMMVRVYPEIGVTGTPEAAFDLTTIRLGTGRVFNADSSLDNLNVTCTATDIPGVDVFF